MNYQDIWLNGRLIEHGYRECESRYAIIKEFCASKFPSGRFTVCDVGAATCYFGLRLREDFPGCSVVAFEPRQYIENSARLRRSTQGGIVLFGRKLKLEELTRWSDFSSFDLTLALSVLHHVKRETFHGWVEGLRGLSRYVVMELAVDDSRSSNGNCNVPVDAALLGYGASHIQDDKKRPIVWVKGFKNAVASL